MCCVFELISVSVDGQRRTDGRTDDDDDDERVGQREKKGLVGEKKA